MSKSLIDKEAVRQAVEALTKEGKTPTAPAVRAACGGKGSYSTVLKLLTELADEASAANDSPQALESFRAIWKLAIQEGRAQRDEEIRNSQETITAMASELSTLEGEATAHRVTAEEATKKCQEALLKVNALTEELAVARETSERNAIKLVEAIEQHHRTEKQLRERVTQEQCDVNELKLKIARLETKLEAGKTKPKAKAREIPAEV